MKTKLVPAKLTLETFIQRTMAGESFYTPEGVVFYILILARRRITVSISKS
jgi:hypothetical protein